jgi:hypothetical protein
MRNRAIAVVVAALALAAVPGSAVARRAGDPETVLITLRPKPGAEADLARVIARHWEVARRLDLVQAEPHLTVRVSDDSGKPAFIDIFTWRDDEVPDNAPPEIRSLWADMNRLTESRNGQPGLTIARASLVAR